ncbi:hypothetical protein M8C21_009356 [Ambrosia artemisiifolia]|uniref:Uncharacterized protein n=1 Tax=Ambrosia artemisiifolia TaxID=4212 RepID=A0AAD5GJR4_AMBAR|nr:hypothetical protein M8C21_009356 [Ambrosia artemisiifolia]
MERGVIEMKKQHATVDTVSMPVRNGNSSKNGSSSNSNRTRNISHGGGQWKPALKSISELGN